MMTSHGQAMRLECRALLLPLAVHCTNLWRDALIRCAQFRCFFITY